MRDLSDKIQCLQKERDKLFGENITLQAMRYYSDETAELRNFNKRYLLQKGRIVQVLARHFSSNNQFFLMNAGSFSGIKKDMIALHNNCIVGRVCEVYPWYCKIVLITDAECKIAVICPRSGASGIHEGINDEHHTVLRHVSHLKKIELDSMVFSSGEGLIFPSGFAVGVIETADKQDLFYSIKIRPALDLYSLSYCVLIAREEIEAISV
jgi:rod shape-determining protein MreC